MRQLSELSGYSPRTLHRIISSYLEQSPHLVGPQSSSKYLILDGTFIQDRKGVFIVMDGTSYQVIAGRSSMEENVVSLISFFKVLAFQGLAPISATIDGNPAIKQALRRVWPDIITQRCLVHIQRQGLSWCRRNPTQTDAKYLRSLFLIVTAISSHEEKDHFIQDLQEWESRFGHAIKTKPGRGRVFSDVKRARSMLISALPDMFHYLKDPKIPKSTNGVEGYFGRMKQKYRQHPGVSKQRQNAFFKWFLYLCKR